MNKLNYLHTELENFCKNRNWISKLESKITLENSVLDINRDSFFKTNGGILDEKLWREDIQKYDYFLLESIFPIIATHKEIEMITLGFSKVPLYQTYQFRYDHPLKTKRFCLTGNFWFKSYNSIITRFGGTIHKNVFNSTTSLIVGNSLVKDSKLQLAEKLEVEIVNETAFRNYLFKNILTS